MDGMFANSRCGNLAYGGSVYVLLIMRVWKETHKGHNNLTKLKMTPSTICVFLFNMDNMRMALVGIFHHWGTFHFVILKHEKFRT
jgi:hypothetical protein